MADEIDLAATAAALAEAWGTVAIDPRNLRPTELIQILNSTPLGEVIKERTLRRHRQQGGYRIGDGRRLDLFRYVAWLASERHAPPPLSPPPAFVSAYDEVRDRAQQRSATLSRSGRDIGEVPEPVNPRRRKKSLKSLKYFLKTYFPKVFYLAFSKDQEQVIEEIQDAIEHGGQKAIAMPRGSGKSAICRGACIWAALKGIHRHQVMIGATETHAVRLLESIRTQFETNKLLLEDFPEVCYPLVKLEGIPQRRLLWRGELIRMEVTDNRLVLPSLPPNPAASCVIDVAGLTSSHIRGINYTTPDGEELRPTLALCDDPQNDESAKSPKQCDDREETINGAILGLAGPDQIITAIVPCTVIVEGDLADRILDRERNPQWQGRRTQMVYRWPTSEEAVELWAQYGELRRDCKRHGRPMKELTAFYRKNRKAMDAGHEVAWKFRYNKNEISALQHAYNIRIDRGDAAFFAEYQNDPIKKVTHDTELPTSEQLAARIDRRPRGIVPFAAEHLVLHIDIQKKLLYWYLGAYAADFSGGAVDYGSYPDQQRQYFTLSSARKTIQLAHPGLAATAQTFAALDTLTRQIMGREWKREDGTPMRVNLCLIDVNWGAMTNVVYEFCRSSIHAANLLPATAKYYGPTTRRIGEYQKRPGWKLGEDWYISPGQRLQKHVVFDVNLWKTRAIERHCVAQGTPGCQMLFGDDPREHRMFGDHCSAETRSRLKSDKQGGREIDVWEIKQDRPDNHHWDNYVGTCVGASILGAKLKLGQDQAPPKKSSGKRWSELRRQKMLGRR